MKTLLPPEPNKRQEKREVDMSACYRKTHMKTLLPPQPNKRQEKREVDMSACKRQWSLDTPPSTQHVAIAAFGLWPLNFQGYLAPINSWVNQRIECPPKLTRNDSSVAMRGICKFACSSEHYHPTPPNPNETPFCTHNICKSCIKYRKIS